MNTAPERCDVRLHGELHSVGAANDGDVCRHEELRKWFGLESLK